MLFRGPEAEKLFISCIRKEVDEIASVYAEIKDMLPLPEAEKEEYNDAIKYNLFEFIFTDKSIKFHHNAH